MLIYFSITASFLVLSYSCVVTFLAFIWNKNVNGNKKKSPYSPNLKIPISLIISLRNESGNIKTLLHSISQQEYQYFEVICVNDHSEDNTAEIIESYLASSKSNFNLKLVNLEKGSKGKKAAITKGVEQAAGELIVTTDADCQMGKYWLTEIASHYSDTASYLMSGPVQINPEGKWFQKLQSLEFLTLVGIGATGIFLKTPSMCNGANLAYPKKIFEAVGGYQSSMHLPSGDDAFLLESVKAIAPQKISFIAHKNAIVRTAATESFKAFFHQRKRWASKWNAHQKGIQSTIALSIFLMYAFWLIAFVLTLLGTFNWILFLTFSVLKYLAEHFYLSKVLNFFKSQKLKYFIPLLYLVYPFYTLIFGMAVQFGHYEWKGRVN